MKRLLGRDWCTKFPDRVFRVYLGGFCHQHDKRYTWHKKSRWTADLELFNDVKNAGLPITAGFMWVGIRCIGWLFWESNEASREAWREIEREKRHKDL